MIQRVSDSEIDSSETDVYIRHCCLCQTSQYKEIGTWSMQAVTVIYFKPNQSEVYSAELRVHEPSSWISVCTGFEASRLALLQGRQSVMPMTESSPNFHIDCIVSEKEIASVRLR